MRGLHREEDVCGRVVALIVGITAALSPPTPSLLRDQPSPRLATMQGRTCGRILVFTLMLDGRSVSAGRHRNARRQARQKMDELEQAERAAAEAAGETIDPLGYYRYAWRPPTDACGTEYHADYDGKGVFNWGLDKKEHVADAAACCAKCMKHSKCNSWVFCPDEVCFAPDAHRHTRGECWLKDQRDPASPSVNMRGAYTAKYRARHGHHHAPPMVQWIAGAIRLTRPATNGTWSGRAVW